MKIGIPLRKGSDVAQQEIRPFLFQGCFSRRIRVVEKEVSFVARARILRFLIPVALEAEFERVSLDDIAKEKQNIEKVTGSSWLIFLR